MPAELDTAEWLRRIRLQNRTELGLEGPTMNTNGGMGDFMYVDPTTAGVPPPAQDLLAYYGAGRQGGTADGWQPSMIDGTQGTYPQVQLPTNAQYVYRNASGQAVSGMGATAPVVSAETKAQATATVKAAANTVDAFRRTGNAAVDTSNEAIVRAQLDAAQTLLSNANWTDTSWGIVGPAYSSRADLIKQLQEARVRWLAKSGQVRADGQAMVSRAAADPRTGQVVVQSPAAAAAGSLAQSARDTAGEAFDLMKSLSKITTFFLGTPTRVVTTTAVGLGVYGLFFTDTGSKLRRKATGALKNMGGSSKKRRKKGRRRRNPPPQQHDDEVEGDEEE